MMELERETNHGAATPAELRILRPGVCTARQVPSDKRVHLSYSHEDIAAHSARIKNIAASER